MKQMLTISKLIWLWYAFLFFTIFILFWLLVFKLTCLESNVFCLSRSDGCGGKEWSLLSISKWGSLPDSQPRLGFDFLNLLDLTGLVVFFLIVDLSTYAYWLPAPMFEYISELLILFKFSDWEFSIWLLREKLDLLLSAAELLAAPMANFLSSELMTMLPVSSL